MPKGAEIDSQWVRVGPAFGVCRVTNRNDLWAAQCAWFGVDGLGGTYRLNELDSLLARGAMSESTWCVAMSYRYPMSASSLVDAQARAQAMLPPNAPKKLRDEISKKLRAHQQSARK
jgi:hypothetical protein